MNEQLKSNLFGMKEVPDVLIYMPEKKEHITLGTLLTCSHQLNNGKSEVRFISSLLDKRIIKFLPTLIQEKSCCLYFINPIRSFANGKDEDWYWVLDSAQLIDYKFGVAADGEPSRFTFIFKGDIIRTETNTGFNIYTYDMLKQDTEHIYN